MNETKIRWPGLEHSVVVRHRFAKGDVIDATFEPAGQHRVEITAVILDVDGSGQISQPMYVDTWGVRRSVSYVDETYEPVCARGPAIESDHPAREFRLRDNLIDNLIEPGSEVTAEVVAISHRLGGKPEIAIVMDNSWSVFVGSKLIVKPATPQIGASDA